MDFEIKLLILDIKLLILIFGSIASIVSCKAWPVLTALGVILCDFFIYKYGIAIGVAASLPVFAGVIYIWYKSRQHPTSSVK